MATTPHRSDPNRRRSGMTAVQGLVLYLCVISAFVFLLFVLIPTRSSKSSNSIRSSTNAHQDAAVVAMKSQAAVAGSVHQVGGSLLTAVQQKYENRFKKIQKALETLTDGKLPARLRELRDKHQIVGERLQEVRAGTETVQEILHGHDMSHHSSNKPPMEIAEIKEFLESWIDQLHETLVECKRCNFEGIWQAYHDLVVKTLYPWDRKYLSRMPTRREDGSIFLSISSYRDEKCFDTIYNAYAKSNNPQNLYVGLVQQNCHKDCRSGFLEDLKMISVPPDDNCYELFCDTELGKSICGRQQVRLLDIDEPESLGPYGARYFASKLWHGEQWFMQTDAHMTFADNWDKTSLDMLKNAPSTKPILSHYPISAKSDLTDMKNKPASRVCGSIFAGSDLESQIIRLEDSAVYDKKKLHHPAFAPFVAAGYFVAHSDFLREVPFDPFLPWIFMGEEIIMSSRLWTAGYDIFSPSESVVGHIYERRHKPKFWESVGRAFTPGTHNELQALVLQRIKFQLGYPESARDMLAQKNVLTAVEQYSSKLLLLSHILT